VARIPLRQLPTTCLIAVAAALGCDTSPPITRVLPAVSPIRKAELTRGQVVLYPEPGTKLQDLVDLRVFGTLRPRMTPDDARATAGIPSETGAAQGKEAVKYKGPFGEAFVIFRIAESPEIRSQYWTLRGHPADGSPAAVFHPAVVNAIQTAGRPDILSIMAANRTEPLVHAYLRDGQVKELEWLGE